ncbi:proprotein convertase P-domain-containing protein [Stackebrandtia albiflava]|uniref:Proprotein convertase P-domain-containing protein n=1 Tax=Stackebrandtia albiflava TaxID=406432 RepID=A0A562VAJ4_9ACTN|nr:M14 family zinc carboxypeptidase [Stackebrandtia albiflava]TWJ14827.1 proprotein convertase P-domain-containing protein [Stackebrandtia albiflava]
MRSRCRALALIVATAMLSMLPGMVDSPPANADPGVFATEPVTWRVTTSPVQVTELLDAGFDVAEYRDGDAFVLGDAAVAERLRDRGLRPRFHDTVYKEVADVTTAEDTFYGGYRTAAAHLAHLDTVAAAHPDLATVYDIGDSWRKTVGQGGHDIKAICITARQPGDCQLSPSSAKPRFSIISQIHAREIATGELTYRWIDHLVNGYGTDTEITELLDTTEVWVVPIANPDGVDLVAAGGDRPVLHRKNANTSHGSCSGTGRGVDLNRNHTFKWGGASSSPCAETYQGPRGASEPEVVALEQFFAKIHPDQRGPADTDPAPADTRDTMISLHAYGNYVIHPWGWTANQMAPNAAALRALGTDMAQYNGYRVGTAPQTVGYTATGSTDDFVYGAFGVAGYTFEVGSSWGTCGGFLPAYSCVDGTFWPANRDAFMTAAQAADSPYSDGDPGQPGDCVGAATTSVPLADRATTESPVTVACERSATSAAAVTVDITHTYRGDLRIDLVAPDGSVYPLKSSSAWDGADDVRATYPVDLSAEAAGGTWTLRVADVYSGDTGTLNSWSVTL